MKKFLLASGSFLAMSAMVSAADLPRKSPPSPVVYAPPAFSWTGFYAGVNAGYGFGGTTGGSNLFTDPSGFIGGGQIGYNYQLPNNIVLGIETDIQYSGLSNDRANVFGTSSRFTQDYFGTVRGRVGYAFNGTGTILDRTLFYGTGGFAYGDDRFRLGNLRSDQTQLGYAVGGGVEYAITNNFTAKLEALYVNLGKDTYSFGVQGNSVGPVSTSAGTEFGLVRAGLNYKF